MAENEKTKDFNEKFKEVGGVWVSDKAISFSLKEDMEPLKGGDKIVAFPNKFKEAGDKKPTHRLYKDLDPQPKQ